MDAAEVLARAEIRSVAERYFAAVDSSDGELLSTCFASRFRFELDLKPTRVMTAHDELRAFLNESWRPAASTHVLGNMHIVLKGDQATSVINAIANVMMEAGGCILLRGLRYTDVWSREDGAWLISERVHKLRWQGVAEVPKP